MAEDRRIRKTRTALGSAIVALVMDKGYEAVTVEHIADRADVTRATFYKHYHSKEQLLGDVVDSFASDVLAAFSASPVAGRLASLLEHARATPDLVRLIIRGEGDGIALRRFTETIETILAEDLRTGALVSVGADADPELLVKVRAGQVIAGIAWFLDTDLEPADAAATINELIDRSWRRPRP